MLHPEVAGRSCDDCEKYLHDDHPTRMGLPVLRRDGAKVERVKGQPTPCRWCPKVPKGDAPRRSSAVELSDRNYLAWTHYRRCKAVNRFPADGLVERCAALIAGVEAEAAEERTHSRHLELVAALSIPRLR